jgi:hypothetical protein
MTLRPVTLTVSIAWALALGATACNSSSSNGAAGAGGRLVPTGGAGAAGSAGGSDATGGMGGGGLTTAAAGMTGASGGAGGTSCGDLPACVAPLVAACPLVGNSCLYASSTALNSSTRRICFGSPFTVRAVETVTNDPDTGAGSTSISVSKGDVVCYTLDGTFSAGDPLTTPRILSFRDPTGVTLATFATDMSTVPNTTVVTCSGGPAVPIANFGNCGMPNNPQPEQCLNGFCFGP